MLQQVYKLQYEAQHHSALLLSVSIESVCQFTAQLLSTEVAWPMQPRYLSFCHKRIWKKKPHFLPLCSKQGT